jgi:uncharacterized protein YecE (DUF72 family)
LPPNLKKDAPRLRGFLDLLPRERRVAFEFRHQSWFDEEVFGLLGDHGAALCIAEVQNDLTIPFVAAADWGYLRLRRPGYEDGELRKWARLVRDRNWKDVLVFFKHENRANTPLTAKRFLDLAALSGD